MLPECCLERRQEPAVGCLVSSNIFTHLVMFFICAECDTSDLMLKSVNRVKSISKTHCQLMAYLPLMTISAFISLQLRATPLQLGSETVQIPFMFLLHSALEISIYCADCVLYTFPLSFIYQFFTPENVYVHVSPS